MVAPEQQPVAPHSEQSTLNFFKAPAPPINFNPRHMWAPSDVSPSPHCTLQTLSASEVGHVISASRPHWARSPLNVTSSSVAALASTSRSRQTLSWSSHAHATAHFLSDGHVRVSPLHLWAPSHANVQVPPLQLKSFVGDTLGLDVGYFVGGGVGADHDSVPLEGKSIHFDPTLYWASSAHQQLLHPVESKWNEAAFLASIRIVWQAPELPLHLTSQCWPEGQGKGPSDSLWPGFPSSLHASLPEQISLHVVLEPGHDS